MRRATEWKPLFVVLVPGSLCNSTRSFHFTARSFRLSRRMERESLACLSLVPCQESERNPCCGRHKRASRRLRDRKTFFVATPSRYRGFRVESPVLVCAARVWVCSRSTASQACWQASNPCGSRCFRGRRHICTAACGWDLAIVHSFVPFLSLLVRWFSFMSLFVLCTYVLAASSFRVT